MAAFVAGFWDSVCSDGIREYTTNAKRTATINNAASVLNLILRLGFLALLLLVDLNLHHLALDLKDGSNLGYVDIRIGAERFIQADVTTISRAGTPFGATIRSKC